jgi:ribosomal protein L37E
MASNISAVKCNNCGRSAIEDFYYKTDEKVTYCRRCGYNYSKKSFVKQQIIWNIKKMRERVMVSCF